MSEWGINEWVIESMNEWVNYEWVTESMSEWGDFPGGPAVKNPPFNAGDTGSITGQGTKIPYAVE